MQIEFIETSRIVEDGDQPRQHFDEESLQGLADSIRQHGVLQPITVTPLSNVNMYRIVTGERRWRATQIVGLDTMPCIIKEMDNDDTLTEQMVENVQREDLQPLEKARALSAIKQRVQATNREVGKRLGMSERSVGYLLDLLELPEEIGSQVVSTPNRPADGQLTEKHARFLRQLNDQPELQNAVVQKIHEERINSDNASKLVRALKERPDKAEEILASPADHLVKFFREPEMPVAPEPVADDPAPTSMYAQQLIEFVGTLDAIRPMEMSHTEVRQVEDALTSVKLAIDGLLRECKLELGETV